MLKRRLIPKLQIKQTRNGTAPRMVLVTTIRFEDFIEIGDPISQAKIYEAQAADELIFLDLDASLQQRATLTELVGRAAEEIFMPITVGGGVRSCEDFRQLLASGADKVSINTIAVEEPGLIRRASDKFGAQCVVLSIDYRSDGNGRKRVWIKGGKVETNLDPVRWAAEGERQGAGEILLTCKDRDGTRAGPGPAGYTCCGPGGFDPGHRLGRLWFGFPLCRRLYRSRSGRRRGRNLLLL